LTNEAAIGAIEANLARAPGLSARLLAHATASVSSAIGIVAVRLRLASRVLKLSAVWMLTAGAELIALASR
jgi:hypothetical protein